MENRRPWPSDGLLEDGQEYKFSSLLANLIVQAHTLHVLKMHIFLTVRIPRKTLISRMRAVFFGAVFPRDALKLRW